MSDVSSTNGISTTGNSLRMTGLATGLDTDSMIKKMMAAENIRLDKMKQGRMYTQWKQDSYRDFIKDFRDLRNSYLLIDSPSDTNLIKSQGYSGSTITSDNENGVTATALPGAVNGLTQITVTNIAKSAAILGDRISANNASIGTISDWSGKTINFSVNGSTTLDTVDIDTTGVTDNDGLLAKINAAISSKENLKGKIKASLSADKLSVNFDVITSDSVKITSETGTAKLANVTGKELNPNIMTKLSDLDSTFTSKSFCIKQNGKTSSQITITKDDTVQDVISKINNAKSQDGNSKSASLYADLQVNYSELNKGLAIQTRNTGSSQTLQILDGDGTTPLNLSILGLSNSGTVQTGKDAVVSITPPGESIAITVTKSSNSFSIDNVTYNLIKDPGDKPYSVNLTAKPDSQKSFDKIKGFVDKYNTLVKKISDKIGEKKNYDYKPLTDEQKKDMKDEDIKAWETKAKQGILKGDGDLQSLLYKMRSAFSDSVKSAGINLSDIGIDTYGGFESVTKPGQLKIDETKLKKALEDHGDQVMKLFTDSPDSSITDSKEKYNNTGIFKRLSDAINNSAVKSTGGLLLKAGYEGATTEFTNMLTKQLKEQDDAITAMNKKLAAKQESYYQRFAKLETAMNRLNAQQAQFSQQFGS